jgi:hypothetical protein
MIVARELINHVTAEPFEPFVLTTASGRRFMVRHPEFIQVGRSTCIVYTPPENNPDGPLYWEKISLMLLESLAPLPVDASSAA